MSPEKSTFPTSGEVIISDIHNARRAYFEEYTNQTDWLQTVIDRDPTAKDDLYAFAECMAETGPCVAVGLTPTVEYERFMAGFTNNIDHGTAKGFLSSVLTRYIDHINWTSHNHARDGLSYLKLFISNLKMDNTKRELILRETIHSLQRDINCNDGAFYLLRVDSELLAEVGICD